MAQLVAIGDRDGELGTGPKLASNRDRQTQAVELGLIVRPARESQGTLNRGLSASTEQRCRGFVAGKSEHEPAAGRIVNRWIRQVLTNHLSAVSDPRLACLPWSPLSRQDILLIIAS
jgi:hypothetical protein